jgi:hypothetical protein
MATQPQDHVRATVVLVDNSLATLGDTAAQVRDAMTKCQALEIEIKGLDISAPGQAITVTRIGTDAAGLRLALDKAQKALLAPINKRRQAIFDVFNSAETALLAIENAAATKLKEWRRMEEERRKAEAEKDQAHELAFFMDRERTAALEERARREQLEAAAALERDGQAAAAGAALEAAIAVPETRVFTAPASLSQPVETAPVHGVKLEGGSSGTISDDIDFEVVDAWAVARILCKPPEIKRKDTLAVIKGNLLMKQNLDANGLPIMAGLRVFRKEDVSFRKR